MSHDSSPPARLVKAMIRQRLADGATASEIRADLVSEFGPDVLSISPRKKRLLALFLAIGLVLVAAAITAALVRSRARARRHAAAVDQAPHRPEDLSGLEHEPATSDAG